MIQAYDSLATTRRDKYEKEFHISALDILLMQVRSSKANSCFGCRTSQLVSFTATLVLVHFMCTHRRSHLPPTTLTSSESSRLYFGPSP